MFSIFDNAEYSLLASKSFIKQFQELEPDLKDSAISSIGGLFSEKKHPLRTSVNKKEVKKIKGAEENLYELRVKITGKPTLRVYFALEGSNAYFLLSSKKQDSKAAQDKDIAISEALFKSIRAKQTEAVPFLLKNFKSEKLISKEKKELKKLRLNKFLSQKPLSAQASDTDTTSQMEKTEEMFPRTKEDHLTEDKKRLLLEKQFEKEKAERLIKEQEQEEGRARLRAEYILKKEEAYFSAIEEYEETLALFRQENEDFNREEYENLQKQLKEMTEEWNGYKEKIEALSIKMQTKQAGSMTRHVSEVDEKDMPLFDSLAKKANKLNDQSAAVQEKIDTFQKKKEYAAHLEQKARTAKLTQLSLAEEILKLTHEEMDTPLSLHYHIEGENKRIAAVDEKFSNLQNRLLKKQDKTAIQKYTSEAERSLLQASEETDSIRKEKELKRAETFQKKVKEKKRSLERKERELKRLEKEKSHREKLVAGFKEYINTLSGALEKGKDEEFEIPTHMVKELVLLANKDNKR